MLVRSAVVGAVATLADLSLLLLLTRALQIRPALANVPTLTLGLLIQFCGNKYFTFADRTARVVRQAARFLGVEAFTLLFNVAAFHLLAVLLHVPVLPARGLGTLAVYVGFSLPAWRRVVFSGATGVVKEAPSKSARSGPGSTHPSPSTSTARRELHSAHETRG